MSKLVRVALLLGAISFLAGVSCLSCGSEVSEGPGVRLSTALLSMLGGVPQTPLAQDENFINFVDSFAMESAYGVARPTSPASLTTTQGLDDATAAWMAISANIGKLPHHAPYLWGREDGPEVVGFDMLQVDRALQFGTPPEEGLILVGDFDAEAISAAYEANFDLTARDFEGTRVWTWGDDLQAGFEIDLDNQVLANPFGGMLGRRQPILISDGLLMSSPDLDLVLGHADAAAGNVPSLAEDTRYRAAAEAVAKDASILQAAIAGPVLTQEMGSAEFLVPSDGHHSKEAVNQYLEPILADYQELPAYELLLLADTVTASEQVTRLALVFPDAETAENAAAVILSRLDAYPTLYGDTFGERLIPVDGSGPRYHVYKDPDWAVLALEFPAPKRSAEELAEAYEEYGAANLGLAYGEVARMFATHDMSWLTMATRAELEALR